MALVPRQLTRAEEDELYGVEPGDYEGHGGGLFQKRGNEFIRAMHDWLRAHHVDDFDRPGWGIGPRGSGRTLLWWATLAPWPHPNHDGPSAECWLRLARDLIAHGADPSNSCNEMGITALMNACGCRGWRAAPSMEMVSLLVDAGADVRAKARGPLINSQIVNGASIITRESGLTALSFVLRHEETYWDPLTHSYKELSTRDTLKIVHVLLRAGAPLDACYGDKSAEEVLREQERKRPAYAADPHFAELKRVFRGVCAAKGSYARYAKKEILVLLALVRKGRAATTWFYAGDHRTAFDILAKSPNEIVLHVLAFSFGISLGSAGAGGYHDPRPRTHTLDAEDFDNDALSIEDEEEFDFDEGEFVIE